MSRAAVHGLDLDAETRCKHWHSPRDIVAIRMKCCGLYYACKDCHDALAGHAPATWPKQQWDEKAILCGACGTEQTIRAYLASPDECPACRAPFNSGCRLHHHFYFAITPSP